MKTTLTKIVLVAFLFTAAGVYAKSTPFGLSMEMHSRLLEGFQHLFNSEFAMAEETLKPLKSQANRHPILALGEVVRYWWEMTSNTLEGNTNESRKFLIAVDWAMKCAQEKIEKGDRTGEPELVMGTTLGLMSRWSAANHAWFHAYMRGTKAESYLNKALEKNPKAVDAYMTLGTFNYAKSLISKKTNALGQLEESETRQTGLGQLKKAYTEGLYFKQASGLLLAGILTNENPKEAFPILEELRRDLPKSPIVHMVHLIALYNDGNMEEMEKETAYFSNNIDTGIYSSFYAPQAYFSQGLIAFRRKKWVEASKKFSQAASAGTEKNPYTTWARLYRGYTMDAMGKRAQAKAQYRTVLKLQRRFASHEHAKERLSKPFSPSDPELHKVEL